MRGDRSIESQARENRNKTGSDGSWKFLAVRHPGKVYRQIEARCRLRGLTQPMAHFLAWWCGVVWQRHHTTTTMPMWAFVVFSAGPKTDCCSGKTTKFIRGARKIRSITGKCSQILVHFEGIARKFGPLSPLQTTRFAGSLISGTDRPYCGLLFAFIPWPGSTQQHLLPFMCRILAAC